MHNTQLNNLIIIINNYQYNIYLRVLGSSTINRSYKKTIIVGSSNNITNIIYKRENYNVIITKVYYKKQVRS